MSDTSKTNAPDSNKSNEQDLQRDLLKLQDDNKVLKAQIDTYKTNESTSKTTIDDLNKRITELQDHNRALFLRITDTPPPAPGAAAAATGAAATPTIKPSIDNVLTELMKKEE